MSSAAIVPEPLMTSGRPRLMNRILSFPVVLAALLCVLAVIFASTRLNDPDMWWHLKMGQIIWDSHSIPTTDLFSYTTNHQASVPQEWLSQLSMYAAFHAAGFSGLMAWLCTIGSLLLVVGYSLCWVYTNNPKISFFGALTIWMFSTIGFSPRPQMIGYLLLLFELLLIHLGRTRNPRWFFGLPLLFAVWVNCHGSFLLGFAIAGIFLFAAFTPFQAGLLVSTSWHPRARKTFLIMMVVAAVALLCNPVGIKQVLYPLNTLFHQPIGLAQVEEWQPLRMSDARGIALMASLVCIFPVVIIRRSELMWDELLLLSAGTWLAVSHTRMLFVFGILVAPVLCRLLSDFWDGYDVEHERPVPNAILIAASIAVAILAFPGPKSIAQQLDRGNPVGAVAFMQANHLAGPMLNEYVYGGYLIWAATQYPVFIDGRADVFEWTGVFAEFARWEQLQMPPRELLDKYKISFCLLARKSPLTTMMALLPDWKIVYQDDTSVIFQRVSETPSSND